MKNLHLIPTENYSPLVHSTSKYGGLFRSQFYSPMKEMGDSYQHIYITSDEEINQQTEPCWCINTIKNTWDDDLIYYQGSMPQYHCVGFKKIILTTDQDLIADGVQAIDDEFLEWFVKNPSCEFVEVKKGFEDGTAWGYNFLDYKIIIPSEPKQELPKSEIDWSRFPKSTKDAVGYVEPKQETLEEAYTNKTIRNWWLDKTEDERRLMISVYFKGGNSENIDTLYGIIPEEMEEIYNINIKEEPKQETTLKDAAEEYSKLIPFVDEIVTDNSRLDFIAGAKWEKENSNVNALHFEIDALKRLVKVLEHQQERMYSEEDMIKFTEWCAKNNYVYYFNGLDWTWGNSRTQHYTTSKELLISWKEQFKK